MIVIEGPDGAGKTTLVRHLAEKFDLKIGSRGVANRDFLWKVTRQDTYGALAHAVSGQAPIRIWDRLWISEYVYHDIQPGRPCEFNGMDTRFIRDVVDVVGCPFIVCLPPYGVVRDNAHREHQMEGVKEELWKIYHRYSASGLPWPSNTVRYDYTQSSDSSATLEDVEGEIEGYLLERRGREAWD